MDEGAASRKPVVLLVEDDPSVARFVEMALDTLPVSVHVSPCVESALVWLQSHRAALVITDLMMPGESGAGLLRRMQATPALAAGARVVVLSAGLDHAVRQELIACGAWRALDKPVPVAALEACVREALADGPAGMAAGPAARSTPAPQGAALPDPALEAIRDYFGGDAALFQRYRATCLAQFTHDAAEGDRALRAADLKAMRRLGHSLGGVLRTLGRKEDAMLARQMEEAALQDRPEALHEHWRLLRERLIQA